MYSISSIYTATELTEMLFRNGFETLSHYGIEGSKFLENKTISMLTAAKQR